MIPEKPTKTFADYLVIAISPALIMLLVHSVCFFLVEVFYRGEAAGSTRWVLFWFVLAVVLIARIGIEQGQTHAMAYGSVLAMATWIYLSTIQPNPVFGLLLLAIVWFTAHKITSNCTLIDDDDDASGQGLLQSLRKFTNPFKKSAPAAAKDIAPEAPSDLPQPKPGFAKKKTVTGIPGIWLIYYSLAALPLFGLGQTLLPAGDLAARRQGFIYLFCYLAAALGLLVTTSFLGLRRYLRQRYVSMPANIAVGWIKFGALAAVVVLLVCVLLPRPGAGEAWGLLRYHIDNQIHRASQYAAKFNPHGSGQGRPGNQTPPNGQPDNNSSSSGQAPNSGQDQSTGQGDSGSQSSGGTSGQGSQSGSAGGKNPGTSMPSSPPAGGAMESLLKILLWIAAILLVLWLIIRNRQFIAAFLRNLWASIRDLIATLFGRPSASETVLPAKPAIAPPFKTFKNPFLTGGDQIWPPEKLITYTYAALQSWVMEQAALKGSARTPREFCRQLADEIPEAADSLEQLAYLYGHVAYGASIPANFDPNHLRHLWDTMSYPRPAALTS